MILYPVDAVRNAAIASIVGLQIFTPEDCKRLIDAAGPIVGRKARLACSTSASPMAATRSSAACASSRCPRSRTAFPST
jgi:hypothetical protein